METSRILGCIEECSGTIRTESGWTAYIGSSIQESCHRDENDHSMYKQANVKKGCDYDDEDDNESDDSMASDASSGPSLDEFPFKSKEIRVDMGPFKNATTKYSSGQKLHTKCKQKDRARPLIKVEKEQLVFEAKSAASHIYGGTRCLKTE
ncbi:protein SOB FIVE-LIKE 4-like [Mercurialis annua]|uniref:protein SOB FIVE-LIKE 4-like n=1 Tax=Mercurialis annua TaxID=3986 RepID=UPI0024AD8602|nr:protein SOB FIVE-LIKE 4-like [Mercurialis annua]